MTDWGSVQTSGAHASPGGLGAAPDENTPSDEELLHAVAAGDRNAIAELYRRHRKQLYATALYTVRSVPDAEDCVQEAFLHAITLAERFRGDCKVASWLHRIVVNACLDRLRRNRVRVGLRIPDDWADTHADDRNPLPDTADLIALHAGLRALSPEYRDAVIAVDMWGMSVNEAARHLQVAPGTVKSRRARARAKLLRLLT